MSVESSRRKCLCCRRIFTADYRNGYHQRYCSRPDCRQASRVATQRKWRRKPENWDYFRGAKEVRRVQEWRQSHPGYSKKKPAHSEKGQPVDPQPVNSEQRSCNVPSSPLPPLQDLCLTQNPAFVGLISMVIGSTLQDDIAATTRQVLLRGQNILGLKVPGNTTIASMAYDSKTSDSTGAVAPGS
jgi:hypothetical protein